MSVDYNFFVVVVFFYIRLIDLSLFSTYFFLIGIRRELKEDAAEFRPDFLARTLSIELVATVGSGFPDIT